MIREPRQYTEKNKYKLGLQSPDDIKYEQGEQIGTFRDAEKRQTIMPIIIDDEILKEINMRQMVLKYIGIQPIIFVSAEFAKELSEHRDSPIFFYLWHELGHVVLNHQNRFHTQKEVITDRLNAIKAGTVCVTEKEADLFAAQRVGAATGVVAIRKLQQERLKYDKEHHLETKEQSILAQKEFEYRMDALQDLAFVKQL